MEKISHYVLLVACLVFVVITIIWGVKIYDGSVPVLDQWTGGYAEQVEGTTIYKVFRWLTFFGSSSFLVPFVIIASVVVWCLHKDLLPALLMATGPVICYILNSGIKLLVQRDRPQILADVDAVGYSFPSGHAMLSIVCYGLFLYFLLQHWGITKNTMILGAAGMILILLIGASRYLIRVHYLTDVVAGFVIGFLLLVFWIGLYNYIQRVRQK